jgi:hypothetical protein
MLPGPPIGCRWLPFNHRFYPLGVSGWTLAVTTSKLYWAKDLPGTWGVSEVFFPFID